MPNINQISLKVCGNPDANSGFQPIVIFNSPSIEIKDTIFAGFDANSYFFTIRIEKNQIVYKLIKNNVSSFGASRQGCLVIGIAIPKGYKLVAGVSPYDVLMKLKKGFLARCMTCKDPVTDRYEFNSSRIQPNILDDIAGSFALVSTQTPYHIMSIGAPIAYVTAPEEKIKLLMNDVQYPAFTKFSEIIVAESVQSTNYTQITNISIPRMPEYSIYNDGVLQATVVNPKQLITVNGNGDTRFYKNESLMFNLEELLKGESVPNVSIDRANEIINVSSKALRKPLTRKINVVFVPEESETYFFTRRNDWTLLYNNRSIPLREDLSFELTGEQLKDLYTPQNFKIQQSRKDQFVVKAISVNSNEIRVTAEKVRQTPPVGGGKTGGGIAQTTKINACEVLFSLDRAYKRRHCSVQFYNTDGVLLQSTTALFSRGNDENHIARVYVPKSWSGSNIHVRLKYKNEYWDSNCPLGKDVNGVIELRDKDFTHKSIRFFRKHSRGITLLILLLLSLLIGGTVGVYVGKTWLGNEKDAGSTLSCPKCSKIYTTETELERHIAEVHSKEDNQSNPSVVPLYCPNCEEGPFDQSGLDTHMSECPKKVKCNECDERFSSDNELDAHKASVHKVVNYDCEICGRTFSSKENLNSHIQEEHSVKTCDVCGQTFNDKNSLNKHKKEKHHFECKECGPDVWYKTKEELDAHIKRDKVKGTNRKHRR